MATTSRCCGVTSTSQSCSLLRPLYRKSDPVGSDFFFGVVLCNDYFCIFATTFHVITMKYIYKVLTLISVATLLSACRTERTTEQAEMMVTIAPLKYIVEQITADDFRVGVLVPAGTSPETFDPTPRQIVDINNAKLLFSTGLIEFEQNILSRPRFHLRRIV